ncbi:MAG TPA: RNA polymerase factor sigma-54 [Gemmatimonadales bacterium]|nr:RNA polymerase factor sigma-54 [Gemmatimonadales bacterium]
MKTGLGQHTGLRQELRINPRLYQAMDLLTMPMMDLQQHLKQELLVNPFLELEEPEDQPEQEATQQQEKEKQEKEQEMDWEEILLNGFDVGGAQSGSYEDREYLEPVSVETPDLDDHLREQLDLLVLTPRQRFLAEQFLGNIGDDGYLQASLEEVVGLANQQLSEEWALRRPDTRDEAGGDGEETDGEAEGPAGAAAAAALPPGVKPYTLVDAEEMLRILQSLDPPGVAARDVRECLLLQLKENGDQDGLAWRLVAEAWNEVVAHKWNDIARRLDVTPAEAQQAADQLARLDPKPGLRFSARPDAYVIPDLIVDKVDDRYVVSLNDQGVPRLRMARAYQDVARDKKGMDQEQREFVNQKLSSAQWMVQAIEQRRQTMLKVMHFIVDRQREFFEKGVEFLKPLTLREVADVVDMHESTISRVTSEKWAQTPRGTYPLKFFFSSALNTTSGEDASARAIKAKLAKMVADEDPSKPLTDQQIVHLFQEQGVQIARRTVAKYRDQLGVLPARMRKRV